LTVEDVLHGQHAAPGTAEQVQAVKTEGRTDLGELLDEPVHVPQGEVVRAIRAPAAELVVEDDPAPVRQGFERLEIVVSEAGAAVQAEQRSRLGVVAHGAVPDLAAGNVKVTLFDFHAALRWWP
jgi:hypothetical protein